MKRKKKNYAVRCALYENRLVTIEGNISAWCNTCPNDECGTQWMLFQSDFDSLWHSTKSVVRSLYQMRYFSAMKNENPFLDNFEWMFLWQLPIFLVYVSNRIIWPKSNRIWAQSIPLEIILLKNDWMRHNSFVELLSMFYRIENKVAVLHLSSERSWPRAIENPHSILMTAIDSTGLWSNIIFPFRTANCVFVHVLKVHGIQLNLNDWKA